MASDGSVTQWISGVCRGDSRAAEVMWERYADQLIRLCRKKLRGRTRRVADEEDAVLSAMDSFYRGVQQGRFPRLKDRHDLWQVIVMITARKTANQLKHHHRLKRGGGQVRGESIFAAACDDSDLAGIAQVVGDTPTPEFASEVVEECGRLLSLLADDSLRSIALWKMEGCTNEEIAVKLGRTVRTVERRLDMIRKQWSREE